MPTRNTARPRPGFWPTRFTGLTAGSGIVGWRRVANLVFQGGIFLFLWFAAGAFVSGGRLAMARALALILCALPFSHENFTWGFQSQFLLGILGGLVHVFGTARSTRPDGRWLMAQFAGLVGILSLASGLLSAAALVALALLERIRGRRDAWWWATLLANGALLAFGFWFLTKLSEAPGMRIQQGNSCKRRSCSFPGHFTEGLGA
ncbi:MAG: hypothetical protein WDM96_02245 [Lacunisphaera sp.]